MSYYPNETWEMKNPKEYNINEKKLEDFLSLIPKEYKNTTGIIIIKEGYILKENYFHGKGVETINTIASVTKSILSALVGIAIEKKYIKNVDEKVLKFFPEYSLKKNKIREQITIKHLLLMSAPYPFPNYKEPLEEFCAQDDWIKYSLELLGEGGEIGPFKYSSLSSHILSAILTKTTGKSLREFANNELFSKIEINPVPHIEMKRYDMSHVFGNNVLGWVSDPKGYYSGGWGTSLTLRDMAKFGLLYQQNGCWKDKQIISKEWIRESTEFNENSYGYHWFLNQDKDIFSYMGIGAGGNAICIIPKHEMVIAISAKITAKHVNRWEMIKENILSAIED